MVWEYKLIQDSKYSTSYGAVATSSLEELQDRIDGLETAAHGVPRGVYPVLSPLQVEAKRPLLEKLRPVLEFHQVPQGPGGRSPSPAELAAILSRINFKLG